MEISNENVRKTKSKFLRKKRSSEESEKEEKICKVQVTLNFILFVQNA